MNFYLAFLIVLSFFALAFSTDDNKSNNKSGSEAAPPAKTTTATNSTTKEESKPKIKVSTSPLCKDKCRCDIESKMLDCRSSNLTSWFSDDEWNALKFGDVQFETIRLDRNNFESVPVFPELTKLKKLILSYNRIKSIEKTAFKDLQQLEILDLSHNRLTSKELQPKVFEGRYSPSSYEPLDNVKELDLSYNDLHTLDPDIFEHFPHLEKLSLSGNVFQVIDHLTETAIASLSTLKELEMSYMELESIPEHLFHAPRGLEKLCLMGNLLNEIPSALSYAINLKTLCLDENPFHNFGGQHVFPRLTKLEVLNLSFLKKTREFGKGTFSGLENLKELYATNNPYLNYIDPSAFARPVPEEINFDYPPIEKLYLHNNNLTVLPKTLLVRWDKVNVIDIRMNPWECDTLNDFLIHDLYPQIKENNPILTKKLTCASPPNFRGVEINEIYEKKKKLREPNIYDSHPENDGSVLIGMLIGLLLGIPLTLGLFVLYRRGCFGLIKRPMDYGGAHYKRAGLNDDYQI